MSSSPKSARNPPVACTPRERVRWPEAFGLGSHGQVWPRRAFAALDRPAVVVHRRRLDHLIRSAKLSTSRRSWRSEYLREGRHAISDKGTMTTRHDSLKLANNSEIRWIVSAERRTITRLESKPENVQARERVEASPEVSSNEGTYLSFGGRNLYRQETQKAARIR